MLLGNFPACRARNLADAEESVDNNSKGSTFSLPNKERDFLFAVNLARCGGVSLVAASCDVACALVWAPADFVRQSFQTAGSSVLTFEGKSLQSLPESGGCLVPPASVLGIDSTANYESLTLRVEHEALSRKLGGLIGEDVSPFLFDCSEGGREDMMALRLSVLGLANELTQFGNQVTAPVLEELAQSTIIKLLLFQRHSHSKKLRRGDKLPSRKQLDNLVDYIFEHWAEPLTVEALARVSGVGARTILRLFIKEKGLSPTSLIKRIRMEKARTMLLSGDKEGSVLSVALKCGFQSFGHFAREYRLTFGELPSDTLRQVRHANFNAARSQAKRQSD